MVKKTLLGASAAVLLTGTSAFACEEATQRNTLDTIAFTGTSVNGGGVSYEVYELLPGAETLTLGQAVLERLFREEYGTLVMAGIDNTAALGYKGGRYIVGKGDPDRKTYQTQEFIKAVNENGACDANTHNITVYTSSRVD